jgi:6-phosphogluconolactonase
VKPHVVVVESIEDFAETCANEIVRASREAIARRGRFALALTGGSTPGPIHQALARAPFRDQLAWPQTDVFFGDERAVPPDAATSNYASARASLLDHVQAGRVFRMEGERADLDAAAHDYEQALVDACDGALDLLVVGIGKDAHVLSLWPGSPDILRSPPERPERVVASIDPPMDPALSRITLTPRAVEEAHAVLAIATGAGKREAIDKLLSADDDPLRIPAHVLRRARQWTLIVDRAAAP